MPTLHLIGIDQRGLSPKALEAIARSSCVFCTGRFRELLGDFRGEILPITPLAEALERMAARLAMGDITVLASGDPFFFGIGRTLIERFGAENVVVHPALSAMQLAFAHCKEPWEDAAVLSLHGRDDQELLPLLLRRQKLFLFTDRHHRPESIAGDLIRDLAELDIAEKTCRIMVAENLGLADERITHGSPQQIANMHFAELNVMIVRLAVPLVPFDSAQGTVGAVPSIRSLSPHSGINSTEGPGRCTNAPLGLTEQEIAHSRGLITKDEVRAAILHRLRLPHAGVLWDVGAGSGSVSVEAARLCPGLTVYAIEKHPDGQANITANRKAFCLANLRLIPGEAPAALINLPAPDRVFIGGSGGQLPAIVEAASRALKPNGIIMASAVTDATRLAAPRLFHQHGFRVECSTITVSRESYPPAEGGPLFLNPITIITGTK
jgi:precorrin-6Y C5,15-methyltransferase (decarboxylating)